MRDISSLWLGVSSGSLSLEEDEKKSVYSRMPTGGAAVIIRPAAERVRHWWTRSRTPAGKTDRKMAYIILSAKIPVQETTSINRDICNNLISKLIFWVFLHQIYSYVKCCIWISFALITSCWLSKFTWFLTFYLPTFLWHRVLRFFIWNTVYIIIISFTKFTSIDVVNCKIYYNYIIYEIYVHGRC